MFGCFFGWFACLPPTKPTNQIKWSSASIETKTAVTKATQAWLCFLLFLSPLMVNVTIVNVCTRSEVEWTCISSNCCIRRSSSLYVALQFAWIASFCILYSNIRYIHTLLHFDNTLAAYMKGATISCLNISLCKDNKIHCLLLIIFIWILYLVRSITV